MARAVARVGKGLACYGDKLPVVRAGAEIELDDTRRASLHDLHSRGLVVGDLTSTSAPPVPATIWRMPLLGSILPPGVSGA